MMNSLLVCCGLILFIVLKPATAASWGANKCTWGPQFWCKSISNAKGCGTIKHCKTNYWNRPVKSDEICNLCKDGMAMVDGYLEQNATQEKIENALMQLCASIPIAQLSQDCKKTITQDFQVIYDELLSIIGNGDLVCSALGLCSASAINADAVDELIKRLPSLVKDAIKNNEIPVASPFLAPVPSVPMNEAKPEVTNDQYCKDCTTFMKDLQDVAANNKSIISDLTDLIKEECDNLGPGISELCNDEIGKLELDSLPKFVKACEKAVDQIVPIIVDAIESNDVNQICSTILMCPSGSHNTPSAGDLCNDCVAFTNDWKAIIVNNQSLIDELNSLISQQCGQLGPEFEALTKLKSRAESIICSKVAKFIQFECDNIAESNFDKYLQLVQGTCSTFVKDYLPQLWSLIEENDAETICSTLYFCEQEETHETDEVPKLEEHLPAQQVADDTYCKDCTTFMTDLQNVAKNNNSIINDLTDLIKEQCDSLGPAISELCKIQVPSLVRTLLPQFQTADVNQICSTILMCPSGSHNTPASGDLCQDCVAFTNDWKAIIDKNQSIINELNSMIAQQCQMLGPDFESLDDLIGKAENLYCNQLPEFLQDECHRVFATTIKRYVELVRQNCSTFVKDYLPQLWDLIDDNDAETICGTLYLCSAVQEPPKEPKPVVKLEVAKPVKETSNPITCAACKFIVHEADKLLEGNKTADFIVSELGKLCDLYSEDIRNECQRLVNTYGKEIIDLLINEVESGVICDQLMLCVSSPKLTKVSDDTACELCEAVTQKLDQLLTQKSTEDDIIKAVEKVCSLLQGNDQSECKTLVDSFGPQIIKLLVQQLSPQMICPKLNLCPKNPTVKVKVSTTCEICEELATALDRLITENSTEQEIIDAVKQVCTILPSSIKGECDSLIDMYGPTIVNMLVHDVKPKELCTTLTLCSKSLQQVSDACELCTLVAQELDHLLDAQSTEEEIIQAVEKVCSLLGSEYESECKTLIEQYGDTIIQLLANAVTPEKLCHVLSLCSGQEAWKRHMLKSSIGCEICEAVMRELDTILGSKRTEDEIARALDMVCSLLPTKYETECKTLISEYEPMIVKLLINLVNPNQVCSLLRLCPKKVPKVPSQSGEFCELCDLVAAELDNMLEQNATQTQIIAALDKVCNILPSTFKSQCIDFLNSNGAAILDLLANELSPKKICAALGVCPPSKTLSANGELCDLCKMVITFLDQELGANATRRDVERALDTLCDKLPAEFKQSCDDLVKQYTPEILELLDHIFNPEYVCLHLRLCSSTQGRANVLIGASPCTYGPSYWCRNEQTARECNALKHCQMHVWE